MTAMTGNIDLDAPALRVVSIPSVQRRLAELLSDQRGRAQWWVEVTRHLDELSAGFADSADELDNRRGLHDQIRADAPHLLGRLRRLDGERDRISQEVSQVRLLASRNAGDPAAVNAVTRAIREVIWRVRRYQEKTTEMLLDAYARDFGGE